MLSIECSHTLNSRVSARPQTPADSISEPAVSARQTRAPQRRNQSGLLLMRDDDEDDEDATRQFDLVK